MRSIILAAATVIFPAVAIAAGNHSGGHGHPLGHPLGEPAIEGEMQTVNIAMKETDDGEMVFEPSELSFAPGTSVRLVITNEGELEHEFVMDTVDSIAEHKELMAKFPEMEHDEPNAVRLQPGETEEILWSFKNTGEFEFACLMLGHYESGMHGPLNVSKS